MTMTEEKTANPDEYNGWTNRETWAIQLHLTNNEGDYLAMSEQARTIWEEDAADDIADDDHRHGAVFTMADYIQNWTEEVFQSVTHPDPDICPTEEARMFVSDVGSWWRADFYEIAEHWIDEAREES